MRSNTPLQALTLLNDQASIEFAEALAARVLREGPPDNPARLAFAFRLALARKPTDGELATTGRLARRRPLRRPRARGLDDGARVLLNLDEFITRE